MIRAGTRGPSVVPFRDGGAALSKKPPYSSHVTMRTVDCQELLFISAFTIEVTYHMPMRMSVSGCSLSSALGKIQATDGSVSDLMSLKSSPVDTSFNGLVPRRREGNPARGFNASNLRGSFCPT